MAIWWWFDGFMGILMGFNGCFMVHEDLIGFHGTFMGLHGDSYGFLLEHEWEFSDERDDFYTISWRSNLRIDGTIVHKTIKYDTGWWLTNLQPWLIVVNGG